jgi:D-alanyl-lipoteichoic acid acyltransferase DltB (MBOAT superfamily)
MLGQWISFVYLIGTMLAWYVSFFWRDYSDRSDRIRDKNGNDPNAQLTWMAIMVALSLVGFAWMVIDLKKSGFYITFRLERIRKDRP